MPSRANSSAPASPQGPGRRGRNRRVKERAQRQARARWRKQAPASPAAAVRTRGAAGWSSFTVPSRNRARPLNPEPMARAAAARSGGGRRPEPRRSSARRRAAPARKSAVHTATPRSRFWAAHRISSPGVNSGERTSCPEGVLVAPPPARQQVGHGGERLLYRSAAAGQPRARRGRGAEGGSGRAGEAARRGRGAARMGSFREGKVVWLSSGWPSRTGSFGNSGRRALRRSNSSMARR